MVPKPPICMQIKIINFPKKDQVSLVFPITSPVTQDAELEVNRAFTKPTDFPFALAKGRFKSKAPIKIRKAKLTPKIRGGFFFSLSNKLNFNSSFLVN